MTSRAVEFTRRIAVGLGGWSLPNLTVTPLRCGSRTGGNRRGESRQCTMRTSREGDSPRCGGGLGRVSRVMPEETLVYWSARASGVAFFVATLLAGSWTCGRVSTAVVRGAWTIACVLLVAHELLAMGLAFGWSQTLAWQNIAAQTLAATGVDSGGGLIVNYAAGVLWSADVAWWWLRPRSYFARPAWITVALWTFLALMFFFGAVVFAAGTIRTIAALMFVLAALWLAYCVMKRPVGCSVNT